MAPRKKLDFAAVRELASGLAGVEESAMYGSPAIKLNGRLLACIATNKAAEPDTLVVRTEFDRRTEMIQEAPDVYYVADHYKNYPVVLVRLSRIDRDALRDLLGAAWSIIRTKHPAKRAAKKRKSSG